MNILIRLAKEDDLPKIIEFNKLMALETENKILNNSLISSGVNNLFHKPEYGFYIVAESEEKVVACLMITKEWSDWRDGLFWWVQSVYVIPAYRRKGIYTKMYNYVKDLAEKNPSVCGFRLYVDESNIRAQKTYNKNGMEKTNYLLFEEITRK